VARSQTLWWGTLTLTAAALLARGLGLVYRILLARFLGGEGLGLYQMALPFYQSLGTLVAAGMPVAVAQLVAAGRRPPAAVAVTALFVTLVVALPLTGLVVIGAAPLARALWQDPSLAVLVAVLAPALPVAAVSAVLRGVYLGQKAMVVPAAAQVAEQVVRVVLTDLLLWLALPVSVRPALAAALVVAGEVAGLLALAAGGAVALLGGAGPSRDSGLARELVRLAVPITAGRFLGSLTGLVEATWIPRQLIASGLSLPAAVTLFGQVTGIVMPFVLFPTALTIALGHNLVPVVARTADAAARRRQVTVSLDATAVWSCGITALLLALGTRLPDLLFGARIPPGIFVPLALGGFALYFDTVLGGILRGLGRTDLPLASHLAGTILELAAVALLAGRPGHGPQGFAVAVALGFGLSAVLNYAVVWRLTGAGLSGPLALLRPAAAALLVAVVLPRFLPLLVLATGLVPAILLAALGGALLFGMGLLALGQPVALRR
jgi:stage V sporulation protein B